MTEHFQRSGVLTIGEQRYAVGLFWQTADEAANARKEAEEAARQEEVPADFFCIREGYVTQFGLGWERAGHQTGMPSAAAALAEDLAGNWLGVFRTNAGWYFVAARRDAIQPDGDQLFDNEQEPRALFEQQFNRGGWEKVFTPLEWDIGGDSTPLATLLENSAASVRLRSLKGAVASLSETIAKGGIARPLMLVLAMLVVGGAAYAGYQRFAAPEEVPVETAVVPVATPRIVVLSDRATNWNKHPLPSVWLTECGIGMGRVQAVLLGWDLVSIACQRTSEETGSGMVVARWNRDGMTIRQALDGLKEVERECKTRANVSTNGNVVTINCPFRPLPPRNSGSDRDREKDWPRALIEPKLWQTFQEQDVEPTIQFGDVPPANPDAIATNLPPEEPTPAVVKFESRLPPHVWGPTFDQIPAAMVQSVALRWDTQIYAYEIRIHERTSAVDEWEQKVLAQPAPTEPVAGGNPGQSQGQ